MFELLNDFNHCRELLLKRLREPAPGGEGTDGEGNGAVGADLLQGLQETR